MKGDYPLVLVEWEDSCSEDGWRDLDGKQDGPSFVKTVGWLIHSDARFITLASSLCAHPRDARPHTACSRMTIPKAVIRKRTKLDG